MSLKELQTLVYNEYIKNGFESEWRITMDMQAIVQKKFDLAELALVTSEVSEAMEEVRKKIIDKDHLAEECADIIIRVLNFMSRNDFDATEAINKKHIKNLGREKLHGKSC